MMQGLAEDQTHSEPQTPKALIAAVIIMGVLIIFATFGLIGVVAYRFLHPHKTAPSPVMASLSSGATPRLALPLAEGEHITAVTSRPDGMMAITLSGPGQARLLLWSPEDGRIVSELDFASASRSGNQP
ncbi:hypothetical protein [Gluconobacter morbifer]|uniref:Uncharacterized protein n=1 Tax=Gluconobacter morbifer G707 TaxID=1088869 RepID=G6XL46_9PROT|nr:hypothetical protein [Gluconobacter morbifer]EHH67475.1 hypothetical protein GMO_24690 [Gluconobacter morbifer G707]